MQEEELLLQIRHRNRIVTAGTRQTRFGIITVITVEITGITIGIPIQEIPITTITGITTVTLTGGIIRLIPKW